MRAINSGEITVRYAGELKFDALKQRLFTYKTNWEPERWVRSDTGKVVDDEYYYWEEYLEETMEGIQHLPSDQQNILNDEVDKMLKPTKNEK